MNYYAGHYRDGQEIRVGDVFLDANRRSIVTVVLHRREALPGWESWLDLAKEGFIFESGSGPTYYDCSDEDQVLIERADDTESDRGRP